MVHYVLLVVERIEFDDCDVEIGMLETFYRHLHDSSVLREFEFKVLPPLREPLRRRWNTGYGFTSEEA